MNFKKGDEVIITQYLNGENGPQQSNIPSDIRNAIDNKVPFIIKTIKHMVKLGSCSKYETKKLEQLAKNCLNCNINFYPKELRLNIIKNWQEHMKELKK